MKRIMHIIATPREEESRTLQVSDAFLEVFKKRHPDWFFDELNLSKEELPSLSMRRVDGKYVLMEGKELYGEFKDAWEEILGHIKRFLAADVYLISTPMWNFSIPYPLKHYIDLIVQPKYLFRYTKTGSEGLAKNKKMIVIASRGGDYRSNEMKSFDFQEPYLRKIFGFVGIEDISFAIAEPTDMGQDLQKKGIEEAKKDAQKIAMNI
jgi:FMN-dependent NADH-azoreductase